MPCKATVRPTSSEGPQGETFCAAVGAVTSSTDVKGMTGFKAKPTPIASTATLVWTTSSAVEDVTRSLAIRVAIASLPTGATTTRAGEVARTSCMADRATTT